MSTPNVAIRPATASDLEVLAHLFDAYRVFYEKESDPEGARRFIAERLAKQDSVIFLAADASGPAFGFIQLYPLFSSVRMRSIWLLNDLFVVPEARRKGVGRALLIRAQEHAAQTGAAGLELATAKDNETAKSVYHRLGWELDTQFDHYSYTV